MQSRTIRDVSGAGDTVISVASLALFAGLNIAEVTMMANVAGGVVCESPGVVPVAQNQLFTELQSAISVGN